MKRLIKPLLACAALAALIANTGTALAFCGFYVAKADTRLFNRASQVVLVRDGDRTVMTMAGAPERVIEAASQGGSATP